MPFLNYSHFYKGEMSNGKKMNADLLQREQLNK